MMAKSTAQPSLAQSKSAADIRPEARQNTLIPKERSTTLERTLERIINEQRKAGTGLSTVTSKFEKKRA